MNSVSFRNCFMQITFSTRSSNLLHNKSADFMCNHYLDQRGVRLFAAGAATHVRAVTLRATVASHAAALASGACIGSAWCIVCAGPSLRSIRQYE